MRLLYITNGFPYPLTTGYLRHYYFIRELSRRHSITLLSIVRAGFVPEDAEAMRPFVHRVMTFPVAPRGDARKTERSRRGLTFSRQGPAVRTMCETVGRLRSEEPFDAAVFSGKKTFPAMQRLGGVPVVVDLCDAASARIRGTFRYVGLQSMPRLALSYLCLRHVERQLIRDASHLVFASRRDRDALLGESSRRATVVPNGVDLDYWRRRLPLRGRNTIVFTGGMDYPPNTDAALYLIEEILPLVRRSVPDVKLLLVGRDPTERLIRAAQRPGVTATGFVEDVRPYLEQATVFAAPLRFGAGIQNKVLEAMAVELPVVATPVAADGLRTADGTRPPIRVASSRRRFAELLSRELLAGEIDRTPDAEARRFVQRHFVWSRNAGKLDAILQTVAAKDERVERP